MEGDWLTRFTWNTATEVVSMHDNNVHVSKTSCVTAVNIVKFIFNKITPSCMAKSLQSTQQYVKEKFSSAVQAPV